MNIELQCCALFILTVIFFMFFREKKLDITYRFLFVRAMTACAVCLVFDILSIIVIHQAVYKGFNPGLTIIVCKLYIMLLALQGYYGFTYAAISVLPTNKNWSKTVRTIYFITIVAGEIAMFCLPIRYEAEGRLAYSYGASTKVAYVLAAIYITATIVISLIYKKQMPERKFVATLLWQTIWMVAAVIQIFVPQLLLVGFASAFGMVILYILIENPSEYIDNMTGVFTLSAMSAYIHDKYKFDKPFSLFTAKINYTISTVDFYMEQNTVIRTARGMSSLGPEPVFRLSDDMFCVVYDDEDKMYDRMQKLKRMKDAVTDVPANASYILIPDGLKLSGSDELFKFIHNYENSDQEITVINEERIKKLRQQGEVRELIDSALKEDRVEVFYQPFYNVKAEKFTAAEALVRIRRQDGAIIMPGEFIPFAEESGQIIPLGIRIFEKVCQFLSGGEAQARGLEYVEVNISAAQFDYENPAQFVLYYMNKYKIDPKWINLEITETANNDNKNALISNMNRLIENGVTFSLDDFGTGRSNLDYFVNMPVKNIKFDYSFTQGYFENDKVKHVLKGMADIMHKMDMKVVSEGIETKEQAKAMEEMGIEYIQGFYYSRPIPKEQFLEFLAEKNLGTK